MAKTDWAKVFDKGAGLLSGIGQLGQQAVSLGQIEDTSGYRGMIDDYSLIGSRGASSFNQLANLYEQAGRGVALPTTQDIRGYSDGQKVGSVLTSVASGASAGAMFGPWGALAGGVIGLGTGLTGMLVGNARAEREAERLATQQSIASKRVRSNLYGAGERLSDYKFRSGISNVAKKGGPLRQQSIQEFASRVLNQPHRVAEGKPVSIQKHYCEGGLKISIKK